MADETEAPELPLTEEGPTEDVDIEITDDDLDGNLADYQEGDSEEEDSEQEDTEEEQAEPEAEAEEEEASDEEASDEEEEEEAPKRKRSPDKRISELARKAAEAERRAQELETRLRHEAELRQQSDMAMMTHYKNNLLIEAGSVKQQLVEAHSMGDSEKIIDLQAKYYKLQNDLEGVENWEAQQKLSTPQVQQEVKSEAQPAQPTLEPRTAQWIQKNTWFQPQSEDFDPEMHEEATLYARRVERRYRSEGRDDEIGGVDYFTEIDRHMRKEFPDAFSSVSTPSKKAPPMARDSNVAPVQRSAPGQPVKNTKSIRLTADQRRMAHQLAESGAIRHPDGRRMTKAEGEKYYAVQVAKQGKGA